MCYPFDVIWSEVPCNGDIVESLVLAEVAQDRFWSLHHVQQHLHKTVLPELFQREGRPVVI